MNGTDGAAPLAIVPMSLIDSFLTRAIRRGELTVTLPGGINRADDPPDPALSMATRYR